MRNLIISLTARAVKSIAHAASNTKIRSWVWTHERPVPESLKR
jgi:cyclic lactone autoinducer peptide